MRVITAALLTVPALVCSGCGDGVSPPGSPSGQLMEVAAVGLALEGPERVSSGWTTIRLENRSGMLHFAVLERLPEGIGEADHQLEVAPVFQEGMDLLSAGEEQAALAKFGELPAWFGDVVFMGGPGLVSAGRTAQTTVYLEPGTYLLECYVKTGGVFHSYNPDPAEVGMVHEFEVMAEPGGGREPEADLSISLSREGGLVVEGEPRAGWRTVGVHYVDQAVHEHFLGHDVHLARLDGDIDMAELAAWMDWTRPAGLETPAPVEFVGGLHEMPAGETGYFTVELEPGRYAWIAEVPGPAEKGMVRPFTVR